MSVHLRASGFLVFLVSSPCGILVLQLSLKMAESHTSTAGHPRTDPVAARSSRDDPSVNGPSVEVNNADLYRPPPHLPEDLRRLMYEMYQLKVSLQYVQAQIY